MAVADPAQPAGPVPTQRGALARGWIGFRKSLAMLRASRSGSIGLGLLVFFFAMAIFAPWLALQDPSSASSFSSDILAPPSLHPLHPLGTDESGRDMYSLLLYGSRVSLTVGVAAALVSSVIGGFIGIIAGFSGGWIDRILTAIDDWFLVIPFLPLAIVLVSLLGTRAESWPGGKLAIIIFVIGITGWAGTSRIIRSQVLSVKERTFVERSHALGAGKAWILRKQILPNVLPLIFANTVLIIALSILSESTLSFLGLGDLSKPSWGTLLDSANQSGAVAQGDWWYFVPPGLCICLLVMGFTMVGYAIEELVNPRLRERR